MTYDTEAELTDEEFAQQVQTSYKEQKIKLPLVRKKKRKPTVRQITALKYVNQGMSKRQAMLKAGYSDKSAKRPGQVLMNKPAVRDILENMRMQLEHEGLTTQYMAQKFKEWMEATKIHTSPTEPDREVPDYDTQIKTYDRWTKAVGLQEEQKKNTQPIKRTLTVTEFITGTSPKAED